MEEEEEEEVKVISHTDLIEENPLRLLMQLNSDVRLPMMRNKARRWIEVLQ